ncbi:MAG: M14-type cytosolic carboxypeptidase, partial [Planctomycetaceae bacterium]|nr:M14-type cytosolic carboxypeptidase [Planctomycetaceae bacterium]
MKHFLSLSFICLFFAVQTATAEIKIDCDFPGGNIKVVSIDGDNVKLAQDLRDTAGSWFYWSFRIKGAEGKTLHFEIPNVVGARGPAISHDGINWHWFSDKAGFSNSKFDYTFKPDEKEVYISQCINYTEKNLNLFLEKHKNNPALKVESLCKSEKGRNVELLRISENKNAPFRAYFSSRHHCGETMGTYAMEGIIETVLSDTEDGKWLRQNFDFFMVPLVDKDGVEDGDQGKNRKPHDHNRDYIQRRYNSIRAITEQVPKWADNKPLFFLDLHCPWLRGGDDPKNVGKGTNEYFYFVEQNSEHEEARRKYLVTNEHFYFVQQNTGNVLKNALKRYAEILEKERKGPIPITVSNILPFGVSWNNTANYSKADAELLSCGKWGSTHPNTVFSSSTEIPFANAEGVVVDADSARKLGKDLA